MCCGTGQHFKLSISFHTPQWLNFKPSGPGWHISSLNVNDLIASKRVIESLPPIQRLRAQNGHSLTHSKSSPELRRTKRKRRRWFNRISAQQEACENWVSQTSRALYVFENPAEDFTDEWGRHEFSTRRDNRYDEKCSGGPENLSYKPPINRVNSPQYLLSSIIPRRSTSLPSTLRAVEITITRPSLPLNDFQLNQPDGQWFRRLLQSSSQTFVQKLMLQLCHTELCIRHIALATVMVRESSNIPQAATNHFLFSKRYLRSRLANLKGRADQATWVIALLSTLLFTEFQFLIGCKETACTDMQMGSRLIKCAEKALCSGTAYVPGYLGDVSRAFKNLKKTHIKCK